MRLALALALILLVLILVLLALLILTLVLLLVLILLVLTLTAFAVLGHGGAPPFVLLSTGISFAARDEIYAGGTGEEKISLM